MRLPSALIIHAVIGFLFCSGSALAAEPVTCTQLSTMPRAEQQRTIVGLRDGFGAAVGVFQSAAPKQIALMNEESAKRGAQTLSDGFLDLLHHRFSEPKPESELVSRVVAHCTQKPEQLAANSFVDVLLGLDTK